MRSSVARNEYTSFCRQTWLPHQPAGTAYVRTTPPALPQRDGEVGERAAAAACGGPPTARDSPVRVALIRWPRMEREHRSALLARPGTSSSSALRDHIHVAWRWWWLVVIVIVAFTLTSFLLDTPPGSPSSPKPLQSAVVGFCVGLFVGIALAFIVGHFDTRVRTHVQAGEILGLTVVGRLPRFTRTVLRDVPLVILTEPEGGVAEALRALRSNLDGTRIDVGWKSLLVTSCRAAEGKTFTLCNLAVALALAGKKVVVVDADLRHPRVHTAFSMPNETGLTTLIQGTISLAAALRAFELERSNASADVTPDDARSVPPAIERGALLVLTSGPPPSNPGEVIDSQRMAVTLRRLANSDADFVLVNAPSLLGRGGAEALALSVDGLLLVANLDESRRPILEDGREAARRLGLSQARASRRRRPPGCVALSLSTSRACVTERERSRGGAPSPSRWSAAATGRPQTPRSSWPARPRRR